jgi:hypothetical protein
MCSDEFIALFGALAIGVALGACLGYAGRYK